MVYPEYVDTKNIRLQENKNKKCRYYLEIPFKNCTNDYKNELCVILKNPSKANKTKCDKTVKNVCEVVYNNKYKKLIILNLFPYYSTEVKGLKAFFISSDYYKEMSINIKNIKRYCNKDIDIVYAWGKIDFCKNIYNQIIEILISEIKGNIFYVECKDCNNKNCNNKNHGSIRYPLHGLKWKNNSKFIQY